MWKTKFWLPKFFFEKLFKADYDYPQYFSAENSQCQCTKKPLSKHFLRSFRPILVAVFQGNTVWQTDVRLSFHGYQMMSRKKSQLGQNISKNSPFKDFFCSNVRGIIFLAEKKRMKRYQKLRKLLTSSLGAALSLSNHKKVSGWQKTNKNYFSPTFFHFARG